MNKFRSKEDLAAAIIAQRGEIESSIKAGESNSLMQATGMSDHASFAKYKEACSAGRLDTPSKHDFVGFTCVAHSQAELGDHVVASVPNELSPDEHLVVTAADLSEAYMKQNPDDKELHSCPMLVPPGQNADAVLADIDKDLQLQSGASHAQVLEAMSKATDDMEKMGQEIGDLMQQQEVAEELTEPEPVAASEAKLAEATETGSDSDGYIQVAEPAVQSMAQLAQHDLDAMVDMAVAEHEEQMEASEASKAQAEQKVAQGAQETQEPQEPQETQQSKKPIKSAAMSQAQLDEQLDQVTREVEAMGNPTLTMKTTESKADKSAAKPSKPSKAELKAAKKSAAKAAKKSNAQLQKQLDQAEHALHPVVRSASKAFGQGKMSLDQVAAKFSKAGLHGATPSNHISPELQQQLNDLVAEEEKEQQAMQGSGLSGAQVAALTRELAEHRAGYQDMMAQHKEIIQQHQDFSQAMHAKATESNLRLQSTVEAVRSFFSNALVNSGHAPLPAIEAGGMQALSRAGDSAKRVHLYNKQGKLVNRNEDLIKDKDGNEILVPPEKKKSPEYALYDETKINQSRERAYNVALTHKGTKGIRQQAGVAMADQVRGNADAKTLVNELDRLSLKEALAGRDYDTPFNFESLVENIMNKDENQDTAANAIREHLLGRKGKKREKLEKKVTKAKIVSFIQSIKEAASKTDKDALTTMYDSLVLSIKQKKRKTGRLHSDVEVRRLVAKRMVSA